MLQAMLSGTKRAAEYAICLIWIPVALLIFQLILLPFSLLSVLVSVAFSFTRASKQARKSLANSLAIEYEKQLSAFEGCRCPVCGQIYGPGLSLTGRDTGRDLKPFYVKHGRDWPVECPHCQTVAYLRENVPCPGVPTGTGSELAAT